MLETMKRLIHHNIVKVQGSMLLLNVVDVSKLIVRCQSLQSFRRNRRDVLKINFFFRKESFNQSFTIICESFLEYKIWKYFSNSNRRMESRKDFYFFLFVTLNLITTGYYKVFSFYGCVIMISLLNVKYFKLLFSIFYSVHRSL
jgi:hypothetical protein